MTQNSDEGEEGDAKEGLRGNCVAGELARPINETKEIPKDENKSEEAKEAEKDICNKGGYAAVESNDGHCGAQQHESQRDKDRNGEGQKLSRIRGPECMQACGELHEAGEVAGCAKEGDKTGEKETDAARTWAAVRRGELEADGSGERTKGIERIHQIAA